MYICTVNIYKICYLTVEPIFFLEDVSIPYHLLCLAHNYARQSTVNDILGVF